MEAGAGKSSSLRNFSWVSHDRAAASVEQETQPNNSANTTMEILGNQPLPKGVYPKHQTRESQHQFLKHNVHQPNIRTSQIQLDTHNNHQHQQHQYVASQPSLFRFSQHPTLPAEFQQPLSMEQSYRTTFPQNQLLTQEDNVGQKTPSPYWKSIQKSFEKPVVLQSDASGLQQLQRIIGPQSNVMNLQSRQQSVQALQPLEDRSLQHKLQQRTQPVKFHHLRDAKEQTKQEPVQQRLQTLATLPEPQGVINQQKLIPSQRVLAEIPSASLEYTASSNLATIAGQHDQAYQMFQSMKEKYLPLLTCIHNKLNVIQKSPAPEIVGEHNQPITAVKKLIHFLSMPQRDIIRFSMLKLVDIEEAIIKFINFFRQKNSVSVQQHAQFPHRPGGESQISQLQQLRHGKHQFHSVTSLSSIQKGGLEHGPSSLQHAAGPAGQNIAGTKQKKHLHNTAMNSFESTLNSLEQNSIIIQYQQQVKHQLMQPENLKQHIQPQLIQSKMQQMLMTNIQSVATSGMLQSTMPHQRLATFPQMSQHSAQIDQENSLSSLSKAGMPLHSASSPSITASPFTPLTPFSKPPDHEKHPSVVSPQSNPENVQPQTILAPTKVDTQNEVPNQSLLIDLPRKSASPSCAESTNVDGNQQPSAIERLLKAVESLTPEALSASISEIGSVMDKVDIVAGTACNDSGTAVGETLAPKLLHHLHTRNLSFQYGSFFEEKIQRKISAMAPDALSSLQSETDDVKQSTGFVCCSDSTETSRIKRRRIEPNNVLLNEIRCINQQLIETVIDLDSTEDPAALHADDGTIVICAYSAVAVNENFMMHASQIWPVLPLRLLVPASYPNSSPVILDGLTIDLSCDNRETVDLSKKTKLQFSICLRMLSEPISLAEIARTWDTCARAVFLENAQLLGADSFSSRYGTWEKNVTARFPSF